MLTGQDVEIRRGQAVTIAFHIPGAAGATGAQWYLALANTTAPADRDLARATGGQGITLTDQGEDLLVQVALDGTQTENLPVGRRYHELWLTDVESKPVPVAEGSFRIKDSLKA